MPDFSDFDPNDHMRDLPGRTSKDPPQKYLDVKWRTIAFRKEHPNGAIRSELIYRGLMPIAAKITKKNRRGWDVEVYDHAEMVEGAIFLAQVFDAGGNLLSQDYGSETLSDFDDFIEKAATKAIGRALAIAGYGTAAATELNETDDKGNIALADAPVEPQTRTFKPNGENVSTATSTAPRVETKPAPVSTSDIKCGNCGEKIQSYSVGSRVVTAEELAEKTRAKYNQPLCQRCYGKRVEEQRKQKEEEKAKQPIVDIVQPTLDETSDSNEENE